jgi:hypothetical protein
VDLTIATSIDTDAIDLILPFVANEELHYLSKTIQVDAHNDIAADRGRYDRISSH